MNKDEAFEKFLKLEKQLFDEIDRKVPGSSRDSLKRKDKLRSQIREILPFVNQKKDGGLAEAIEKVKAKEMETGGEAVPKKFKGFSKLPEAVQEKMDPTLAKKFEDGGPVKMGSGGGVCRGMGIARAGGKFKLR